MSKARREEIEDLSIRGNYLERLAKAKIIPPQDNFSVIADNELDYGVPWL